MAPIVASFRRRRTLERFCGFVLCVLRLIVSSDEVYYSDFFDRKLSGDRRTLFHEIISDSSVIGGRHPPNIYSPEIYKSERESRHDELFILQPFCCYCTIAEFLRSSKRECRAAFLNKQRFYRCT